jgi:hypothetical protein
VIDDLPVREQRAVGSWFHLPLTSHLDRFGRYRPYLASVTLLFSTQHCWIMNLHVWDGSLQRLAHDYSSPVGYGYGLSGDFLDERNPADVDPTRKPAPSSTFANTWPVTPSPPVFSAIGISFYACATSEDVEEDDRDVPLLTVAGGGAQLVSQDPLTLQSVLTRGLAPFLRWRP